MRRITLILLLLVAAVTEIFAQDSERKSYLVMTWTGNEGTEMTGCYQWIHLNVRNPTQNTEYITAEEGLYVFYIEYTATDEIYRDIIGELHEDIELQPGESKDIRIKVNHQSNRFAFGAVGTFLTHDENGGIAPRREFADIDFMIEECRGWNISGDINVEDVMTDEGERTLARFTLTNKESKLFTPSILEYRLYHEDETCPTYTGSCTNDYFESGVACTEIVDITDKIEVGQRYHIVIGYTHDGAYYDIAKSAEFVAGECNSINSVSQEAPTVIYDLQGRRLNEAKQKGLYIINGRKVVR